MGGYTALASRVLRLLRTARQMRALNRVFGSLFVMVGVLPATFKRAG
jgi:homoserine/homoserine lactone efflux protein